MTNDQEENHMHRLFARVFMLVLALFLLAPVAASAAGDGTVVGADESTLVWSLGIGFITPLVTYVLNHVAPWRKEQVKGPVLAIVAAAVGALVTVLDGGTIGFNRTTELAVFAAVVTALYSHGQLYVRSGINAALGGGSNKTP